MIRTIPSDNGNKWRCEINGVKYAFPAGETIDVPAEVAELIDAYNATPKAEKPPKKTALPEVSGSGKALVSVGGEWVEQAGYGYTTLEPLTTEDINCTLAEDETVCYGEDFAADLDLTAGDVIDVTYDGVLYPNLQLVEVEEREINAGAIPNEDGVYDFSVYPFSIEGWSIGGVMSYYPVVPTDAAGVHAFSISKKAIKQIDEKYIPSAPYVITNVEELSADEILIEIEAR